MNIPTDILAYIIEYSHDASRFHILMTCKLWNSIGRPIYNKRLNVSPQNRIMAVFNDMVIRGKLDALKCIQPHQIIKTFPMTGFYSAISQNNLKMVKWLAKKYTITYRDDRNGYAIFLALRHNSAAMVQTILNIPNLILSTSSENEELSYVIESCNIDLLKILLQDSRINPAANHSQSIVLAASEGDCDVIKILLADGRADPAARHNAALTSAARTGHKEICIIIMADPRVDMRACGDALEAAVYNGHTHVVELLLSSGVAIDGRIDTLLSAANRHGDKEIMHLLNEYK